MVLKKEIRISRLVASLIEAWNYRSKVHQKSIIRFERPLVLTCPFGIKKEGFINLY